MASASLSFVYDSDALIQILLTDQQSIFQLLRDNFSVTSYLMSEVDAELRSNKKIGSTVKPKLDKVIKTGLLHILSSSILEGMPCESPGQVSLADIRSLGSEYAIDVGIGESVTHAAGYLLGCPVVSNDMNAVKILEQKRKCLPPTILRSFDLFAFAHIEKYISDKEADQISSELRKYGEWLPKCLANSAFKDGIRHFDRRLDTSLALAAGPNHWSAKLYLARVQNVSSSPTSVPPSPMLGSRDPS